VTWRDRPIANFDVNNHHQPVSANRLCEILVERLGLKLLDLERNLEADALEAKTRAALYARYLQEPGAALPLSAELAVSIVVATYDRPTELYKCLQGLTTQKSPRQIEIIVVDNNPGSGLTPPVLKQFPNVKLITESRHGSSYARNAGIAASSGDIIVAIDDAATVPTGWLEKLIAPFARPDVMIVTGKVLPQELSTPAQRLFERYNRPDLGFESFERGPDWFESFKRHAVPTWRLGEIANAAFRTSIFTHPDIGLLEETLGPGTLSGFGEDIYLFYKVLKAGYILVYEPNAYIWHKQRPDMQALHQQIYSNSKGHVAYHLMTLFHDRDLRALLHLAYHLPHSRLRQVLRQVKARSLGRKMDYPFSFTILEIVGNLVGPLALWRSKRRVRRAGHSSPYKPPSQRDATSTGSSF
jgi:GT2 family glycosyltransferase